MRLLQYSENGELSIHSFDDQNIPRYAILSHTWGADRDEVSFADLQIDGGKTKPGYQKILFCGRQARQDGLNYFWIDTCCINKSTSDELSAAINSMFRWYQRAVKCYVFLSDIETPSTASKAQAPRLEWESVFRRTRWFQRGWTLQELLAPGIVEFFSYDGTLLGDKTTLEHEIHQVTNIPLSALRQAPLSDFSIGERISWVAQRTTSKKEDKAYCLLGILGVFLPLIYGEEEEHAFRRLREEAEKQQARQLIISKARETKGTMQPESKPCFTPLEVANTSQTLGLHCALVKSYYLQICLLRKQMRLSISQVRALRYRV